MAYSRMIGLSTLALIIHLKQLERPVLAFSAQIIVPSCLSSTRPAYLHRPVGGVSIPLKIDDGDSFPDPHALMEYLDGDSSTAGGQFLSFEEYQELQRKQRYLSDCPIFRGCSDADLSRIAKSMVLQEVRPGEKLVVQGESGDAMYFLKSGSLQAVGENVAASNQTNSAATTIYTTYSKEGSFFGELALLFGQTRAASIVSASAQLSEVYRLDKVAFLGSIVDSPVYETAKRLILSKYQSNRLLDVLPQIRLDEIVGLIKAGWMTPKTKNLRRWLVTFRTFSLGVCATILVTSHVKTIALKSLAFVSLAVFAHLL